MSQFVKRNRRCRYYKVRKRNSSETYVSTFKVAFECKEVVGVFPLPVHLVTYCTNQVDTDTLDLDP